MTVTTTAAKAAKAFLESLDLDTVENFYTETESPETDENTAAVREVPCVLCYARKAEQYPFNSGNWNIELVFKCIVSADDMTAAQAEAVFEEVFDAVFIDTFCADISAVAGVAFHVFGYWNDPTELPQVIEGRMRVKELVMPINCCAKNIS